jgi:hypothetical protein
MMKTQTRLVPSTQHTTAITMIPVVGSLGGVTPAQNIINITDVKFETRQKIPGN